MKKVIVTVTVLNMLCCFAVYSHPGRLDANGGHYNRQTGEYHYHDGTHHSGGDSSEAVRNIEMILKDAERERQREEALKREERRQELREQAERERLEKEEQKQKEKERYVSAAHALYFVTVVAVILIIGAWQDYFSSKTKCYNRQRVKKSQK